MRELALLYVKGEKVVDLWAGLRNKQTGEAWEQPGMRQAYHALTLGFYEANCCDVSIHNTAAWVSSSNRKLPRRSFGNASSFGSPGSGGSLGFADPAAGIGYAYVTSQSGTALTGDPRDVALREALYSSLKIQES